MSKNEFDKLINGEILENNKKHEGYTNSVGFCFMKTKDNEPEFAYEFLSGIVSDEVCVVFETKKKLRKSYGVYADPYGHFFDTITEDEYCIQNYSLEDFKIVRIAIPKLNWNWYFDMESVKRKLEIIAKKEKKQLEEYITKKELESNYSSKQSKKLLEFANDLKNNHEIEIKIGDKYYKIPCSITEMSSDPNLSLGLPIRNTINIKFETWIEG